MSPSRLQDKPCARPSSFFSIVTLALVMMLSSPSLAGLQIPTSMSSSDRVTALKILGLGTGFKNLADPYPLGGYSGFEFGASYELLNTGALAGLGHGTGPQGDTSVVNFTMGKGLFYDVDFFLQFSPLGQGEKYSSFGGAVRWGLYELQTMPVHLVLQASATSANFQNKITTTTQNLDLIGGWNLEDIVFFAGLGFIRSSGLFSGGVSGVTDNGSTVTESVTEIHSLGGVTVKYAKFFMSAEIDRASQATWGLKIGMRY